MKIYSKIVWDKDWNVLEQISSEYNGPVAEMCIRPSPPPAPPPPPPPPPAPAPSPVAPATTTRRRTGRSASAAGRGRGVLVSSKTPLGIVDQEKVLGGRRSLLQAQRQVAQSVMRLLGGGY